MHIEILIKETTAEINNWFIVWILPVNRKVPHWFWIAHDPFIVCSSLKADLPDQFLLSICFSIELLFSTSLYMEDESI